MSPSDDSNRSRWFGRRGARLRSVLPWSAAAPGRDGTRSGNDTTRGHTGTEPADALMVEEYDGVVLLRSASDDTLNMSDVNDLAQVLTAAAEQTVTVITGAEASSAGDLWPRLGALLDSLRADGVGAVRLVMSAAGDDRPHDPAPARRIADAWEIEVIAPDGLALVVPGGGLFVPEWRSDSGTGRGGWWRFTPGAEPVRIGSRQPAPDWQTAVERVSDTTGGCVIDQIPAGLLARSRDAAPVRVDDLCYAVPADPRDPALLLGGAEGGGVTAADVVEVLEALPEAVRAHVRLVPAGSHDILRTGQSVADTLDAEVAVHTGMPLLSYDGAGTGTVRSVVVGADGAPRWWPFVEAVACVPAEEDASAPSPRLLRWSLPVTGRGSAENGSVALSDQWRVTVTRAGLWITDTDDGFPSAAARAVDPEGPAIELGHPGRPLDASLFPELGRLLAQLDPGVRARSRLLVHGTCADGGRGLRRTAAEHGLRAVRFGAGKGPAPQGTGTATPASTAPPPRATDGEPDPLLSPPIRPTRSDAASELTPHKTDLPSVAPTGPTTATPTASEALAATETPSAGAAEQARGRAPGNGGTAETDPVPPPPRPARTEGHEGPGASGRQERSAASTRRDDEAGRLDAVGDDGRDGYGGADGDGGEEERTPAPGPLRAPTPRAEREQTSSTAPPPRASAETPSPHEPRTPEARTRPQQPTSPFPASPAPAASASPAPVSPAASATSAPATSRPQPRPRASSGPLPAAPFLPGHVSTEAQQTAFRALADAVWERHSAAVTRALTRMPALRGAEQEAARVDLIALHVYLHTAEGPLSHSELARGLRAGDGGLLAYAACVSSALRRMPSYRGVAFRGTDEDDGLTPGTLLRDAAPVGALPPATGVPRPDGAQYVIWSFTGRRVRQLASGSAAAAGRNEIVFAPSTLLRVLDVRKSDSDAPLVLLREVPANERSAPAAAEPRDTELNDHDRAALDRLDEALRAHPVAPGPPTAEPSSWPDLCKGPLGQDGYAAGPAPGAVR
ncbi:hypothetical protein [Streptomyces sp. 3N207]|uniref:hypothetical protein n=1 Tax=Streptomyces sp. 3N207 TaxID=3457417 RepID=UPI003FD551EE